MQQPDCCMCISENTREPRSIGKRRCLQEEFTAESTYRRRGEISALRLLSRNGAAEAQRARRSAGERATKKPLTTTEFPNGKLLGSAEARSGRRSASRRWRDRVGRSQRYRDSETEREIARDSEVRSDQIGMLMLEAIARMICCQCSNDATVRDHSVRLLVIAPIFRRNGHGMNEFADRNNNRTGHS